MVKERRGAKLVDDADLFTGMFWTAKKGLNLGLVDALGDMRSFLKLRYGEKTKLRLVSQPKGIFGRRLGLFGSQSPEMIGAAADSVLGALEERASWSRFGL